MSQPITFRQVAFGSQEYDHALALRAAVLRTPLGLRFTAAEMAREPHAHHFVALEENVVTGTLLLEPRSAEQVQMRQVAVAPDRQGAGIGAGLVRLAEEFARAQGFRTIMAHARDTAVRFYERLGYRVEGDPFVEQTIPHQIVTRDL